MADQLLPLTDAQARAAWPWGHRWVSASAGTGKTQVLTARVLRLLVDGARPESILALTFTKAAAAEMQGRIFAVLGRWVMASDENIAADLKAIQAMVDEKTLRRARTLFAEALEVRGGFKVQTLHGFASALLAAFPIEADVVPGYDTLDDRSGAQLKREVLERAISDAAEDGDTAFLDDLGELAIRKGDAGAQQIIADLLRERHLLARVTDDAQLARQLRAILGLAEGEPEHILQGVRRESGLDDALRAYSRRLSDWGTKTSAKHLPAIEAFFAAEVLHQSEELENIFSTCFTQGGTVHRGAGMDKMEPELSEAATCLDSLRDTLWRIEIAEAAALHLRVGRRLAARYEEAKHSRGAVDFDDLISRAADLLSDISASWVLYKLDQQIEHVLVDEGQDTNAAQWKIVEALTAEFFAGEGAHEEDLETGPRTTFAVGDYKQAIFGFQGTDPEEFRAARDKLHLRAKGADQDFVEVPLARSFRSVPAVLTVTDKVLELLGPEALGLDQPVPPHEPQRANDAGAVTLWPRLDTEENPLPPEEAEQKERALARRIAAEVKGWVEEGRFLPAKKRAIQAGDVLILVRSRGDLVPELVAALHDAQVPVAGADRLRLTNPLAVKDCLSLIKFALQPDDDLAIGELLVSPFLGWSQWQLYEVAQPRPEGQPLWLALRNADSEHARAAVAWLRQVLDMADFMPPYEFLEAVLSGPLEGRRRLLQRLGEEARDPLEELLNQALQFERTAAPSLQGFLDWLAAADDIDVKRDPEAAADAVRIMTVHGAKGLQAPVVILADAAKAGEPRAPGRLLAPHADGDLPLYGWSSKALPPELAGLYAAATEKEARENLRLLYVALTRAEDYLYVGGLAPRSDRHPSWWDHVAAAIRDLDHEEADAPRWGGPLLRHRQGTEAGPAVREEAPARPRPVLPAWAREMAPKERQPPRPLAPSAGEDEDGLPPPGPGLERAAERGRLLHRLFERLPDIAPEEREAAMQAFLGARAVKAGLDADALAAEARRVMRDPAHARLFSPEALREAPVTAVVEGQVIAGTLDLLLVTAHGIEIVDYKTDRAVPESADQVPERHRRQMARYAAALSAVFPDRPVRSGLLYTAGPKLVWL